MPRCLHTALAAFFLAFALPVGPAQVSDPKPAITSAELLGHVRYLASDELEGRAAGSPGARRAADYIATEFARLGLSPIGNNGTYFQNFSIPRGFQALASSSLTATWKGRRLTFAFGEEMTPASASASGKAHGPVVFVGYGVSAADLGYDDYAGLDLKGKVALALSGVPGGKVKTNPFGDPRAARRHGALDAKIDLAAGRGAVALLVANDPAHHKGKTRDRLSAGQARDRRKIPAVRLTAAAGRKLLARAGLSLAGLQRRIDASLRPQSREIDGLEADIEAVVKTKILSVRNVAGLLEAPSLRAPVTPPSAAPLTTDRSAGKVRPELLVVGAHYDHVGRGEFASLGGPKARGQVHNGADDNASGTAGMLEIAGLLAGTSETLRRDVLFLAFTAEEMGLLGSKHYIDDPLEPLAQTVAMINLDMVGRLEPGGHVEVYGTGTAPSFERRIAEANHETRLDLRFRRGVGRGVSDHYSFYKSGIPVLFFFTGLHDDYHRPSDDWQRLRRVSYEKVVRLAGSVALGLGTARTRPIFTTTSEGGLEAGPYVGVAVEDRRSGAFIADVARSSPAARMGLKKDDRLVELNDREIDSAATFYGLWSRIKPGEPVNLVVSRAGRSRTLRFRAPK